MITIGRGSNIRFLTYIDDVRDIVDTDVAEAIQELHIKELDSLQYSYDNLKCEVESYEASLEQMTLTINDTINSLEKLIEDINNSKRLNRKQIISVLKCVTDNLSNHC